MTLDRDVDGMLAAWAATVRLPEGAAAGIYQQIVATPAPDFSALPTAARAVVEPEPAAGQGLDPSWWRTYTADFTERMVASTRPLRWAA
jgi:hypothetical protein